MMGVIRQCLAMLAIGALALHAPATAQTFPRNFTAEQATTAFLTAAERHNRDLRDLYSIRGIRTPPMGRASIQSVAQILAPTRRPDPYPANTGVLFYAMSEGQLTVWLIGADGLRAASRAAVTSERLTAAIRELRLWMGVDGIARSRAPVYRDAEADAAADVGELDADSLDEAIGAVSNLLLPPEIVRGLDGLEHLVIVANGAIGTVPHALLNAGRERMLIDRVTVSVSAGLFDVDQMIAPWSGRGAFSNPLIVGDPAVPPDPRWRVARLPGAQVEANALAAQLGAAALIGEQATKARIAPAMGSASVIYFAAHGISNPEEPLTGGFLMLAGMDPVSAYLTAGEVTRSRLRAQLAVLSACQSGLGMIHDGGVIGLARSFQKAGVPRVVMSLWSVSDEATVTLMSSFNRHVMTMTPAAALRQAMLEARATLTSEDGEDVPALWAPFVLFGTPR